MPFSFLRRGFGGIKDALDNAKEAVENFKEAVDSGEVKEAFDEFRSGVKDAWRECREEIKGAVEEYTDETKSSRKDFVPDISIDKERIDAVGAAEALHYEFEHIRSQFTHFHLEVIRPVASDLCFVDDQPSRFRPYALDAYYDLKNRCQQFLERMNEHEALQLASKILGRKVELKFNFSAAPPDLDTSTDNENWNGNMEQAFSYLSDNFHDIPEQLDPILEDIEKVEKQKEA